MKKYTFCFFLFCITFLIGCSKEQTFDDFFRKTMTELHQGEENFSYSLIHKEFDIVHENDAITMFIENKSQVETIFIAYYEKEDGNWNWRQTTGATWNSPIKWSSMVRSPYIYLGAINDNSISEVYAGEIPATIIEIEENKRVWYAISDIKDVQVKMVNSDGTQEIVEQTIGDGWIKKEY